MKYYFIKYNKLFYSLYAIIIMLIFSAYTPISLCAEEELVDNLSQKENNNLNYYFYYTAITILSMAAVFTIYSAISFYYPSLDYFNLFNDINIKEPIDNTLQPFTDRYSLKTISYNNDIDPTLYKKIIDSNIYLVEQNKLLIEANLRYQEQLEYLWYKLDVPNLDYLKNRPEPLTEAGTRWIPINKLLTSIEEVEIEEDF